MSSPGSITYWIDRLKSGDHCVSGIGSRGRLVAGGGCAGKAEAGATVCRLATGTRRSGNGAG